MDWRQYRSLKAMYPWMWMITKGTQFTQYANFAVVITQKQARVPNSHSLTNNPILPHLTDSRALVTPLRITRWPRRRRRMPPRARSWRQGR